MSDKNVFLAKLNNEPTLVAPESQDWFAACIRAADEALTGLNADFAGDADDPQMSEDFWEVSDWRARVRPYNVKNGILHIDVKGVLLKGFPYQFGYFATGYEYIWEAFKRGMGDTDVKAIAFDIDSPGGMVNGCFDCVDKMFDIRDRKPVHAYANEHAYSAAYAIASVAQNGITVARSGGVGSVGVVTMHIDQSAMMESVGLKVTYVHAGKHKVDGNPFEALPDDVKARMQERINALYDEFVSTVARNRSMDERVIRSTEALTFTAQEAVSNGMADAIGSFDDAVAALAAEHSKNEGDYAMSKETDKENAAVDTAATQEALNQRFEDGKAEGQAEGAQIERGRINTILSTDAGKVRPKAALSAALKTNMTAEEAESFLADLPEESTLKVLDQGSEGKEGAGAGKQAFDAAMSGTPNPEVGADTGTEGSEGGSEMSDVELARSYGMPGLKAKTTTQ